MKSVLNCINRQAIKSGIKNCACVSCSLSGLLASCCGAFFFFFFFQVLSFSCLFVVLSGICLAL